MKRPAFMFYPSDWRKDTALQSCSLAAQGLWINLMCLMHECEQYGHLMINGTPMSTQKIAPLVGKTTRKCQSLIQELSSAGVFSRNAEGAIYSRRMVKDEHIREVRAKAGHAGWEAQSGERESGKFARAKSAQRDELSGDLLEQTVEQKTAPSFAFALSASAVPPLSPQGGNGKPKRRRQRLPATAFPIAFEVTEKMSAWAQSQGLPADRVMPVTEEFCDYWRGDGRMKSDWIATWRNSIRRAVRYAQR